MHNLCGAIKKDFNLEFIDINNYIILDVILLEIIKVNIYLIQSSNYKYIIGIDYREESINFIWHGSKEDFEFKKNDWMDNLTIPSLLEDETTFLEEFLQVAEDNTKLMNTSIMAKKYNLK